MFYFLTKERSVVTLWHCAVLRTTQIELRKNVIDFQGPRSRNRSISAASRLRIACLEPVRLYDSGMHVKHASIIARLVGLFVRIFVFLWRIRHVMDQKSLCATDQTQFQDLVSSISLGNSCSRTASRPHSHARRCPLSHLSR